MDRALVATRAAWMLFWWLIKNPEASWAFVDPPKERPPLTIVED